MVVVPIEGGFVFGGCGIGGGQHFCCGWVYDSGLKEVGGLVPIE